MKGYTPFARAERRACRGETLISVLIAALIMGIVTTLILSLFAVSTKEGVQLTARIDNLNAARIVLERLGRQVRMARNIGDVQGIVSPASDPTSGVDPGPTTNTFQVIGDNVPLAQVQNGTACNMSASFPSPGNPFYGPNQQFGLTTHWPWGGNATTPYTLSRDTLIIQVPTFDANGFPNSIQTVQNLPSLDTYVYRLVDDPGTQSLYRRQFPNATAPRFYQLQWACFPAPLNQTNKPTGVGAGIPMTILKNIVGPLDDNGNICAFQYVNSQSITGGLAQNSTTRNFDSSTAAGALNEQNLALFTGVIVDFQILTWDARGKVNLQPVRSEVYLHNNSQASVMGTPPGG